MIDIFIPTKIKNSLSINSIDPLFKSLLTENFSMEWKSFQEGFFEGLHGVSENFSSDIIVTCNGTFGSTYFIDYDWQNNNIKCLGQYFFDSENIGKEINSISKNYEDIVFILKSNNLLTNTKKEEIINKISSSLFLINGIAFMLNNLLEKTLENIKELENIANSNTEKIEYSASASVIIESPKSKEIELKTQLEILNNRASEFIELSNKFLI